MLTLQVANYARIADSIVGWGSSLGKWTRVEFKSVIGEDVHVRPEVFLNGSIVLPHKEIKESIMDPGTIIMWAEVGIHCGCAVQCAERQVRTSCPTSWWALPLFCLSSLLMKWNDQTHITDAWKFTLNPLAHLTLFCYFWTWPSCFPWPLPAECANRLPDIFSLLHLLPSAALCWFDFKSWALRTVLLDKQVFSLHCICIVFVWLEDQL